MKGASTNADGEYQITGIEPGTYTVEVTYIGYSTISQESAFQQGLTLSILKWPQISVYSMKSLSQGLLMERQERN